MQIFTTIAMTDNQLIIVPEVLGVVLMGSSNNWILRNATIFSLGGILPVLLRILATNKPLNRLPKPISGRNGKLFIA